MAEPHVILSRCRRWPAAFGALLVWAGLLAGGNAAAQTLYLNTGVREPYTTPERTGFLDQIVAELFGRLGMSAQVLVYDATERGIINANKGIEDGLVLRIRGLDKAYGNLVMVPEKLIDNDFVAVSVSLDIATDSWAALKPYEIAYIIGWKVFEANLPAAKEITTVSDADQLFNLLRADRTELILYERWQAQWRLRQPGARGRILEPPLARTEMFMYLHKDKAALVPRLSEELARMKQDGTYQAIFDRTLRR